MATEALSEVDCSTVEVTVLSFGTCIACLFLIMFKLHRSIQYRFCTFNHAQRGWTSDFSVCCHYFNVHYSHDNWLTGFLSLSVLSFLLINFTGSVHVVWPSDYSYITYNELCQVYFGRNYQPGSRFSSGTMTLWRNAQ